MAPGKVTASFSFNAPDGNAPVYSKLVKALDGKMYGVTSKGGRDDKGTIFSYDPNNSTYTRLKDFNSLDGYNPQGSLMQATDELLYGITLNGGTWPGSHPYGSLPQAYDGKLYHVYCTKASLKQ